jgi:hypothetical protein
MRKMGLAAVEHAPPPASSSCSPHSAQDRLERGVVSGLYVPAVLEPDLDLLGLDVAEDGAVPDKLLPAQRGGLGALVVHALQRLHLLRRVPHVLARVHVRRLGGGGAPRYRRHGCCGTGPGRRTARATCYRPRAPMAGVRPSWWC